MHTAFFLFSFSLFSLTFTLLKKKTKEIELRVIWEGKRKVAQLRKKGKLTTVALCSAMERILCFFATWALTVGWRMAQDLQQKDTKFIRLEVSVYLQEVA